MDHDEIKREHDRVSAKLRAAEFEAAPYRGRGEPLPPRLRIDIAHYKASLDELRLWGFKARTQEIREYIQNDPEKT